APAEICKTGRYLHHSAPSGRTIGAPSSSNRHLKVKEFPERYSTNPNRAELWMLVSLRLLNALKVRIKLKPKEYCPVLDIFVPPTHSIIGRRIRRRPKFLWQRSTR